MRKLRVASHIAESGDAEAGIGLFAFGFRKVTQEEYAEQKTRRFEAIREIVSNRSVFSCWLMCRRRKRCERCSSTEAGKP